MKVAVIGTGKTGSKVIELLGENRISSKFDSVHRPDVKELSKSDIAIVFIPGSAVAEVIEKLIEADLPAVWGTTGFEWPETLENRLIENGLSWVRASNFSLGMNIIRKCLNVISDSSGFLPDPTFHIHEIHHVDKVDAPSGTAISWEKWLGKKAEITSERKGDIKGIHQLHVKTASESIWLKHKAHDRKVFAEGAVWAAEQILNERFAPGLIDFSDMFDNLMAE